MTIMNKQKPGTLSAFRWNNGIAFGLYGKGNFASFEYDDEEGLLLLINQDRLKQQEVKVKYVTNEEFNK